MGLYPWEIEVIKGIGLPKRFDVISFGHPDILATPTELKQILGITLPVDNKNLDRAKYRGDIVGNARIVFGALGGQMFIVDSRQTYNIDAEIDLNYPITPPLIGKYDLAIDPGTSEHCFNVGQALVNMAKCVKVGGYIYHRVPLCHWNHGFWNFSPCAFHDFYTQNGFALMVLSAETNGKLVPAQPRKGAGMKKWYSPDDAKKWQLVCVAKRVEDKDIGFPIQYKYLGKPRAE